MLAGCLADSLWLVYAAAAVAVAAMMTAAVFHCENKKNMTVSSPDTSFNDLLLLLHHHICLSFVHHLRAFDEIHFNAIIVKYPLSAFA